MEMEKYDVRLDAIKHFEKCVEVLKTNKIILTGVHKEVVEQEKRVLRLTGTYLNIPSCLMHKMIISYLDKRCSFSNMWDILVKNGLDEEKLEPLRTVFQSVDECIKALEQVLENIK